MATETTYDIDDIKAGQKYETLLGETLVIVRSDFEVVVEYPERDVYDPDAEVATAIMAPESFAAAANYEGYTLLGEDDEDADEADEEIEVEAVETIEADHFYADDEDGNMAGEFHGPIHCPTCNKFMSTSYDGEGFPAARCSDADCIGWFDVDELLDEGHYEVC